MFIIILFVVCLFVCLTNMYILWNANEMKSFFPFISFGILRTLPSHGNFGLLHSSVMENSSFFLFFFPSKSLSLNVFSPSPGLAPFITLCVWKSAFSEISFSHFTTMPPNPPDVFFSFVPQTQ